MKIKTSSNKEYAQFCTSAYIGSVLVAHTSQSQPDIEAAYQQHNRIVSALLLEALYQIPASNRHVLCRKQSRANPLNMLVHKLCLTALSL